MKSLRRTLLAVASTLVLQACGGGGDSSETPPPPSANTPAPVPGTTPTPTPTPSPIYETTADFTRDRSFTATGATATLIQRVTGLSSSTTYRATLDAESSMIGFDFIAAARRYRARYQSDAIDVTTVPMSSPERSWDEYDEAGSPREVNGRYFGRTDFRSGQTYSGFALWREGDRQPLNRDGATTRIHRLLFGAKTQVGDMPTAGTATYKVDVDLSRQQSPTITIAQIGLGAQAIGAEATIDWSSRRLTGRINVAPPSGTGTGARASETYTIEGTVSATGRLTGTLTGTFRGGSDPALNGTSNGYSGTLDGYVYGPRGGELGFLYTLVGADAPAGERNEYVGAVLGKQ